jgi:hypothetical protein
MSESEGMMRRNIAATMSIIMLILAVSCRENTSDTIQHGTWDVSRQVFTNEWSNLRFTLPEGFNIATEAEINEMIESGSGQMDDENKAAIETTKQSLVSDFLIYTSEMKIPSFQMNYEDLNASKMNGISEAKYIVSMESQFKLLESQGIFYTKIEEHSVDLAGRTWSLVEFSLNEDKLIQDIYLHIEGSVMYMLTLTYTPEYRETIDAFLSTISPVK